jgi:anti-anti-sigma regulatory factor
MKGPAGDLRIDLRYVSGITFVYPVGILDITTYATLRDTLLKCASEQPDALLVDVEKLVMPSVHALTVFSSVAARIGQWPKVPLMLVATHEDQRSMLAISPISRFVAIHDTIYAAVAAADRPLTRARAVIELPPSPVSARRARQFARLTCRRWQVDDLAADAVLIITALVENTLRHTDSVAFVRLELRRGILTVAVSDDDPHEAILREQAGGGVAQTGLLMVSGIAKAWGCVPTMAGGKTVWATLKHPAHVRWSDENQPHAE